MTLSISMQLCLLLLLLLFVAGTFERRMPTKRTLLLVPVLQWLSIAVVVVDMLLAFFGLSAFPVSVTCFAALAVFALHDNSLDIWRFARKNYKDAQ